MIKTCAIIIIQIFLAASICWSENNLEGRDLILLEGNNAKVVMDLGGGSIVDFSFVDQGLNPFTWNYPEKGDLKPRNMGHFICFDRLGRPSPQEIKNGMPFHGEAAHVEWELLSKPVKKNNQIITEMRCELPIGGMRLKRILSLYENSPVFIMREEITNINKLGRVYNIVQHPSLAPPFLDESVLVDSNAIKGFWSGNPMPSVEEPVVYWPKIIYNGELVDLRRFVDIHGPNVVSFVFEDDEEYGWVTACNSEKGLMIGYFWKLSDYPWFRIWRNISEGNPIACGLEFGTTPLPLPFSEIIAKGKIFDRPTYKYLDADQTVVKSYTTFLSKIPPDYKGVDNIKFKEGTLTIIEYGDASRDIIIKIK
ncbi:hypothetical protein ACFL4V_01465 [Candidatus Latescibacterota bacterium]